MIKLVLTLDRRDFLNWCRENDIDPADRSVRHIRDDHDLRGLGRPFEIVNTERFWDRRDCEYLLEIAKHLQERYKDLPDPDLGPTSR